MRNESDLCRMLSEEGLKETQLPRSVFKPNDVVNTAIELFHSFLDDDDPRWQIAYAWTQVEQYAQVQRIHKEVSLRAIHLSDMPSFRNGYSQFSGEPNIRQICRAIFNLSVWPQLKSIHDNLPDVTHPKWFTKLARTARIRRGTNGYGVTGCPEALYQLQMWEQTKDASKYIGRIGFNMHLEQGQHVVSITNLQGIPDGKKLYENFAEIHGLLPFNVLMQNMKTATRRFSPNTIIRGLRNPNIENPDLLNTVLHNEAIPRYSFHRE